MSFLSSIARHFVETLQPRDWVKTKFVFPNHRSGVFFSNSICQILEEKRDANPDYVIFGLHVTTLGDLLRTGTDLEVADQVTLRCELYKAYKEAYIERAEQTGDVPAMHRQLQSFDTFYSWAGVILNDFADIDSSLVDPLDIYRNITNLQQMSDEMDYLTERQRKAVEEFWHVVFEETVDEMGDKKLIHRRFVEDYQLMESVYKKLRANLRAKGLVYPAMLTRDAAEADRFDPTASWGWDEPDARYVFIGFSMLTPAEEKIMRRLSRSNTEDGKPRAEFYWDYQPSMIKGEAGNSKLDPGFAIKRWVADPDFMSPKCFTPPEAIPTEQQELTLVETAYSLSQPAIISSLLADSNPVADDEKSVIVLPDQQLLLPVMGSIPDCIKDVNVTMGYELKFSLIASFSRLLLDLFSPLRLRKSRDNGKIIFSVKAIQPLLSHPYVIRIDGLEPTRAKMREFIKTNKFYVSTADVADLHFVSQILALVPPDADTHIKTASLPIADLCRGIQSVFTTIFNDFAQAGDRDLDRETIHEALMVVRRLSTVFDLVKEEVEEVHILMRILCSMIDQQKVDFQGMPFGGLQVMGILETRAVDFDNVYILDMNEGSWPPPKQNVETMIPLFIRKANGMVTPDNVDATYNYYFYRLKSRAKKMTFIRPTVMQGTRVSQKSRYLLQIEMLDGQKIKLISAQKGVVPRSAEPISIDKHSVAEILTCDPLTNERALKISPTGFGDYIKCPLLFYFKRLAHLRVDDEISEEADVRDLGLVYHSVMEHLYKPQEGQRGRVLTQIFLDGLLSKEFEPELERLIFREFRRQMNFSRVDSIDDLNGRNIITFYTLKKIIRLTIETEEPGSVVVATEEPMDNLPLHLPSGRTAILTGTIDRQHIAPNGTYYVADYKTGSVDEQKGMKITKVEDLFDPKKHDDNKALLQIMMYSYYLRHKPIDPVKDSMTPCVVRVRNLSSDKGGMSDWLSTGKEANPDRLALIGKDRLVYAGEIEQQFESLLLEKIDEIFDLDEPFTQTEYTKSCNNCDFKNICRR